MTSAVSWAQEARGAITGRVLDAQGALIPGAKVSATNTATNETRRATSNDTGYYELNYLEPSIYSVTVETQGFKKAVRQNLTVNVGTRLDIDMTMEIGGVTETIQVTGEAPLLETTSASGGRVLDQKALVNLPFSDLNPFALSALAPGMQWTGQPEYRRPFDNGGTSAFNTMGGVGQNEYTIDGTTVTGSGRRVGYTPPADSITEFKLETSNFDASQGFTSGAAINVVSRAGTNKLSGSVFNQHWQQRWNATNHFTREQFNQQVAAGRVSKDAERQATGRSNNYGLTASGPVWIPKIFNGKNKLFWTITWNGIQQSKAETTDSINSTVPTMAMRQGDFSQLLNAPDGARRFTIYDPRSARLEGSTVVRTPFPGNRGVPILNPTYAFYVKLYPTPNNVPGLVTPEQTLNYLGSAMPKNEKFNSMMNRYDYVVSDKHRVNFRWQWNDRLADEYDWTYETVRGLHSNGLTRINRGGNIGYLWTLSSRDILDANFGISRFEEGSRNTTRIAFGPKDVGLPDYLQARAGANQTLPSLDFDTIQDVGGGYPVVGSISTQGELRAQVTSVRGSHSFKYGWQERRSQWAGLGPGNSSGTFAFRNNFTRSTNIDNFASNQGHDWAAFMMGLPNSIGIDTNDSTFFTMPKRSLYFQDDWRVNRKLRVSMGLRYEREGGIAERFNRALSGVFLPDVKTPFTDAAEAAYRANPPAGGLPAAQFKASGGTTYMGQNGYDTATRGTHQFLPKFGTTYSWNDKTVLKAGYGMYMDTLNVSNTRPDSFGYNQATGTPVTNDAGLTICCNVNAASGLAQGRTPMNDPFPVRTTGTRFDEPLQSKLGSIPRAGRGFTSLPWDFRPAVQQRWRFGVQRELARDTVVEVSYNGAYSTIPVTQRQDVLAGSNFATGNVRNQAVDNALNANVPNPFNINNMGSIRTSDPALFNYMSGQGFFTGTVIALNRLLRPYSAFSTLNGVNKNGYNKYTDLQVMLERRYAKGFTSSLMYTWANSNVADFFANEFDANPTERINNNVLPHRLAWTAVWEMPFGKGRAMAKSGFVGHLVGNWNLSWIYQRQSGPATDWGNRFFYGDLNQLETLAKSDQMRSNDLRQWFDPSIAYRGTGAVPSGFVGFEGRAANQPGSYHVRVFPQRTNAIRADGIRNWDVKLERIFPIMPERGIQIRTSVDLLNATNHTNFSGPNTDPSSGNFGRVTSQRGLPRVIQLNLRVEF